MEEGMGHNAQATEKGGGGCRWGGGGMGGGEGGGGRGGETEGGGLNRLTTHPSR